MVDIISITSAPQEKQKTRANKVFWVRYLQYKTILNLVVAPFAIVHVNFNFFSTFYVAVEVTVDRTA